MLSYLESSRRKPTSSIADISHQLIDYFQTNKFHCFQSNSNNFSKWISDNYSKGFCSNEFWTTVQMSFGQLLKCCLIREKEGCKESAIKTFKNSPVEKWMIKSRWENFWDHRVLEKSLLKNCHNHTRSQKNWIKTSIIKKEWRQKRSSRNKNETKKKGTKSSRAYHSLGFQ